MNFEIRENLAINISGFSGTAVGNDYASTAFQLSSRMWKIVKENGIKNKGKNIWVYEDGKKVFAGVETEQGSDLLEQKRIVLNKYAYYKHIGSYKLIGQSGQRMTDELKAKGYETVLPYIEIYGHWTEDESKLETELLMCLK